MIVTVIDEGPLWSCAFQVLDLRPSNSKGKPPLWLVIVLAPLLISFVTMEYLGCGPSM